MSGYEDAAAEILAPLRTPQTTDVQWAATLEAVRHGGEWSVEFPAPGQLSVRLRSPDGVRTVIRPDGGVVTSEDPSLLPGDPR